MTYTAAMFPLGLAMVPGAQLPLHVFEPRYRAMVEHCLDAERHEFGVVMIEQGHEVGGGDRRATWGTMVQMVQVGRTDDGRYGVLGVGTRRIRVERWLDDDPYPLADIDDWPDDDEAPPSGDRLAQVAARVRRCRALAAELGDLPAVDARHTGVGGPGVDAVIGDDPSLAVFRLVSQAPLSPYDVHGLLGAHGPASRLQALDGLLDDVEQLLHWRLTDPGDNDPGAPPEPGDMPW